MASYIHMVFPFQTHDYVAFPQTLLSYVCVSFHPNLKSWLSKTPRVLELEDPPVRILFFLPHHTNESVKITISVLALPIVISRRSLQNCMLFSPIRSVIFYDYTVFTLSERIRMYVYKGVCVCVCVCVCMYLCLSICLSTYLSIYPSIFHTLLLPT